MKIQIILALGIQMVTMVAAELFAADGNPANYFNILTIDGGGIRGILPGVILKYMEAYAYTYATSKNLDIPVYPGEPGKMAMKDLFNMTGGTSTGSILAAGLAYPDKAMYTKPDSEQVQINGEIFRKPGFFADDLLKIYTTEGKDIFAPNNLGWVWVLVWLVVFVLAFTALGYWVGVTKYDNPEVLASFQALNETISNVKRQQKGKISKYTTPINNKDVSGKQLTSQLGEALLAKVAEEKANFISKQQAYILGKQLVGIDFQQVLRDGIRNHTQSTKANLGEAEKKYIERKPIKWVVTVLFFFIGLALGYEIPKITNMLNNAKYSRVSLDKIMHRELGAYSFAQALTQELLVVSYEYNSQEPRFYSKYFLHQDPGIYDVPIGNATGSSSAAPTFFDPHRVLNKYGFTELQIDGGVICNNPSLYAYSMARDLYGYKKIRMLSLGTGEVPFTPVDPKEFDIATVLAMNGEFMMNMDAFTADFYLKTNIPDATKNYYRAQMDSKLSMDDVSPPAIKELVEAGDILWKKTSEDIEAFLRMVIDERYHPKKAASTNTKAKVAAKK